MSNPPSSSLPPSLIDALERSRAWGFLGDGPLDLQVDHALGFARAASSVGPGSPWSDDSTAPGSDLWMDLGTGGGIPGLVLAYCWPDRPAVLLDSNERRAGFLRDVVEDQGWTDRIRIVVSRAETAGRRADLRGAFSLVVARSFGPPPVTAECAAPFLRPGGLLVVSEPPQARDVAAADSRWPAAAVGVLGLVPLTVWRDSFGYQILREETLCPERFPRRDGVPAKRPLYRVGSEGPGLD